MALDKCHYAVLGVVRTASEADIRKAYKRKALQLHPDKNQSPNAEAEFKQLHKAYSVLNDAKQKRAYDEKKATPAPPPRRESATNQDSGRAGSGRSTSSQQRYDRYDHMTADYNHESTRDFINKIMREDRDVKKHKQDMSFQSWYRKKQGDWRKSELEEEKREEQRRHKEDMERWAAEDRASRLKDIQKELERKKQEEQSRKAREAAQEAERAKAFEQKRKQAMEEIEEEEQRFKAKFKALDRKWMGTKVAADRPKDPPSGAQEAKGARQSSLRFTEDGELDDNSLEEALEEVRKQRESLKQEQQDRRKEAADAWREVAAVRAGNYDFDSKRRTGGPSAPVRSAKEELAAARAALDAAISGDDSLAANFTPSSASCRSSRIDPLTKHLPRPKSPDEDNDSPRINLEMSTPEGSPYVARTRPEGPDESMMGEDLNAAFIGDP